jgi:alkaline phosphatase D
MILNDGEIERNWTMDRIRQSRRKRVLFNLAIGAYMSYQWSHGPRTFENRLYYKFKYGGYPFFVLDTRSTRYIGKNGSGLADNIILGPPLRQTADESQLDRLLAWLKEQQISRGNVPKFIVSPTAFVPNPVSARRESTPDDKEKSDSWAAFPETRKSLLKHIIDNKIQNVVFLSGGTNCSNVAEINFSGETSAEILKAFSINSSPFYSPSEECEPSDYVHDSRIQNDTFTIDEDKGIMMDYKAYDFTKKNNFAEVIVNQVTQKIQVMLMDRNGETIKESSLDLKSY